MSWEGYISNMVQRGDVETGAVIGLDGSIWANTSKLTPDEAKHIVDSFNNATLVQSKGIKIGGEKFMFLKFDQDDGAIQCRKGQVGLSLAKSNTCILLGLYNEHMHAGNCSSTVQSTRNYLKDQNY